MSREPYEVRWKDYYQVLGIEPSANLKTIRQAWQRLAQTYHPDVAGNSKANLARNKRLHEAYEVLSDRDRRAKYDEAYQARNAESPETSPARPVRRRTPQSPPLPASTPIPIPAPMPMPPTSQQPQPEEPTPEPAERHMGLEEPTPEPAERRLSLAGRSRLMAAAGAVGVLALIAVGVMPGLLAERQGPAAPQPSSLSSAAPTPLPTLGPMPTPSPSETTPQPDWSPEPTGTLPAQSTFTPTSTPVLRDSIPVMSPEAAALEFRSFQTSGNPWLVNFSGQCQEAPCLRSGPIWGAGSSALALTYLDDLPSTVRTISFDVKAASPACCASFQVIAATNPITVKLPTDGAWTRIEVAVPETRPVAFKWEFWSGPSGLDGADAIWLDNIQFK